MPVLTCIAGVFLFDEEFGWMKAVGMVLVLGGAAAIALRGKINRRRMESGRLPSVVYQRESMSKGGNDETYPQR